jgi:hypothetical protein
VLVSFMRSYEFWRTEAAAWRNLKINQFEVAPRIEDTSVRDESGRFDT